MKTYVITIAVIRNAGKFLLGKRTPTKRFSPNQWEFVSGFMDMLGSAEEIIISEIKEELSADGKIIDSAPSFEVVDDEGRWVIVPFLLEVDKDQVKINPKDHSELKWVSVDELYQNDFTKSIVMNPGIEKWLRA